MKAEEQDGRDLFLTVDATVSYGNDLVLEMLIPPPICDDRGWSQPIDSPSHGRLFHKPLNTVHSSWTGNWKPVPFTGKRGVDG